MKSKLKQLLNILDIKRIPFREDINGLRAIAVMSVVFYHADFEIFQGGWLGVDIFFVISGYLISNIIISELNQETFSFKKILFKTN
jgi:peptidoglycan/LPS O-acetylase OafA/YrhL